MQESTSQYTPNRLILFAHFDTANRVEPYILHHLRALRALGGRLHFISNSPLAQVELARLEGLADQVLLRENTGCDFSMWQAALAKEDLAGVDELLLTNSSVLGPVRPLAPVFRAMENRPCDFWAMTESGEGCPHLQSYFMVFRRAALASEAFGRFWASVLPYRSKQNVIFSYEMGLSVYLAEHGLRGAAAFPLDPDHNSLARNLLLRGRATRRIRMNRNPTLFYPDLLARAGMPYLKVSLWKAPTGGLHGWFLERLFGELGLGAPGLC